MARELSIVYGTLTIGGSSGREIHNVIINTRKFEEFTLECEFDISKTTNALFITEIADVELAFRTPFQNLTVTQDGTDIYTFSQSSNTGLDAKPEIYKREDNASGRSRRYAVRISLGLPANTGAEAAVGLREHSVEVAYDPARRRTVTVAGVITAVTTNSARAQYEAVIAGLETSVFSALSITAANRELIEEPAADHTYNNKTISFRRVWRELVFSQGGSSNDDAALKGQVLTISRRREAPGDTADASRLATLDVNYSAWMDKDNSTDMRGKYTSIRSWMMTQVSTTMGGGSLALLEEEPNFDYDDNKFTVRLVVRATTGSNMLERTVTVSDDASPGWVLAPVWNGRRLAKYDYQGPASLRRTITDVKLVRGYVYADPVEFTDAGASILKAASLSFTAAPYGLKSKHMRQNPTYDQKKIGRDGYVIDVTQITGVDVFEFYEAVAKGTPTLH